MEGVTGTLSEYLYPDTCTFRYGFEYAAKPAHLLFFGRRSGLRLKPLAEI